MESGRANAIGPGFLSGLESALVEVRAADVRGVVLTGYDRFFSAGLDLVELWSLDRSRMTAFLHQFDQVFLGVFDLPKPVVAAVNGHAVAGGCILACTCDARVMADGAGKIGMPEIELGLPFPTVALEVVRSVFPANLLLALLAGGANYPPGRAKELGIVDAVVPPEALIQEATDRCQAYARKAPAAYAAIKQALHAEVQTRIRSRWQEGNERFLDCWFSDEGRARIGAARERLQG